MHDVEKQSMIRSLPPFSINRKIKPKESNLNGIVQTVKGLLPPYPSTIETRTLLSPESLYIMADRAMITEAVLNFAGNAVEAMPRGGTLTISTDLVNFKNEHPEIARHFAYGACALLSVADTGVGMDKGTMGRMFEPFFTTKPAGIGLGLPVAYSIVKQHGGCMKVQSVPARGTTIKVYLPLIRTEKLLKTNYLPPPAVNVLWSNGAGDRR
jgi:signal transduction histidine kinase